MSLWSRWPSPLQPGTQCRSTWESWGVTICANQGTAGRVLVPLLAARPFHVWSKTSRTGEKETRGQEHFPSKTCRQVNRDKRDKLGSRRPRFQNSAGVTATSCPPSGPWLRREPVDRPGRAPASRPPPRPARSGACAPASLPPVSRLLKRRHSGHCQPSPSWGLHVTGQPLAARQPPLCISFPFTSPTYIHRSYFFNGYLFFYIGQYSDC